MPKPCRRTRSKKRVYKALPGGNRKVHYELEVTSRKSCSLCGKKLAGLPRLSPSEIGKLNRTKRRVWRMYGGKLCHSCVKNALKQAIKALNVA